MSQRLYWAQGKSLVGPSGEVWDDGEPRAPKTTFVLAPLLALFWAEILVEGGERSDSALGESRRCFLPSLCFQPSHGAWSCYPRGASLPDWEPVPFCPTTLLGMGMWGYLGQEKSQTVTCKASAEKKRASWAVRQRKIYYRKKERKWLALEKMSALLYNQPFL